jgi:hypothetical protein
MVIISNLDVCEVASDRDQICGGSLVSAEESLTLIDTDLVLSVSTFALTDGFSFVSTSATAATMSLSGDSSSSSSSQATI